MSSFGGHRDRVRKARGRPVAKVTPAGTGVRFTGADLKRLFAEIGPFDAEFARDIRRARRELNKPPKDPWASSSTRRS